MYVDLLSAEIGSTITIVSAFHGLSQTGTTTEGKATYLGQGTAPTTVLEGDVRQGLEAAIEDLKKNLSITELQWGRMVACSSAAGGLRMSVHGLVYDMTVKAAREAALGAGANISQITSGPLREEDIKDFLSDPPNIILIAGGVDYGERDTALENARIIYDLLRQQSLRIPIIYAGNIDNHTQIQNIYSESNIPYYITDNVYPRIDELVIEPARKIIQEVFEEHIIKAPGMEYIRDLVDGPIMPVPGAVMKAAQTMEKVLGNLLVFDIGGATSDLHSVCADSPEIERILISPEPYAKRTVEGDLGMYVNKRSVLQAVGSRQLCQDHNKKHPNNSLLEEALKSRIDALPPIPNSANDIALTNLLCFHAGKMALDRHAGRIRKLYTISGKQKMAQGKDLSAVKYVLATGGALTRLGQGQQILKEILESGNGRELYPSADCQIHIDTHYIMASVGVMIGEYRSAGIRLLLESFGLKNEYEGTDS